MELVEFCKDQLDRPDKQRQRDQRQKRQQRIHDEHQNDDDDDGHDIDDEVLQTVYEEPVNRCRVGVDLRHQTARLTSRKERQGQTLNGREDRLFQVINDIGCDLRRDRCGDHREEDIDNTRTDDDHQNKQDVSEERACLR